MQKSEVEEFPLGCSGFRMDSTVLFLQQLELSLWWGFDPWPKTQWIKDVAFPQLWCSLQIQSIGHEYGQKKPKKTKKTKQGPNSQRFIFLGICILIMNCAFFFFPSCIATFITSDFIQTCDFTYLGNGWIDWPINAFFRSLLWEIHLIVCMH